MHFLLHHRDGRSLLTLVFLQPLGSPSFSEHPHSLQCLPLPLPDLWSWCMLSTVFRCSLKELLPSCKEPTRRMESTLYHHYQIHTMTVTSFIWRLLGLRVSSAEKSVPVPCHRSRKLDSPTLSSYLDQVSLTILGRHLGSSLNKLKLSLASVSQGLGNL